MQDQKQKRSFKTLEQLQEEWQEYRERKIREQSERGASRRTMPRYAEYARKADSPPPRSDDRGDTPPPRSDDRGDTPPPDPKADRWNQRVMELRRRRAEEERAMREKRESLWKDQAEQRRREQLEKEQDERERARERRAAEEWRKAVQEQNKRELERELRRKEKASTHEHAFTQEEIRNFINENKRAEAKNRREGRLRIINGDGQKFLDLIGFTSKKFRDITQADMPQIKKDYRKWIARMHPDKIRHDAPRAEVERAERESRFATSAYSEVAAMFDKHMDALLDVMDAMRRRVHTLERAIAVHGAAVQF